MLKKAENVDFTVFLFLAALRETVFFDVDAREYNGKWYNQIRAWKVERQAETATQNNQPPVSIEPFPPMPDTDALPFGNDNEPPF